MSTSKLQENQDALVKIQGLKKYFKIRRTFGNGATRILKAVDGVSLTVRPHETVGLVGESGCGKSTFGRTILRLYDVTEGSIFFEGEDITGWKQGRLRGIRPRMQMVFQDPYASLDPRKTILQSVKASLDAVLDKLGEAEKQERAKEMLDYVGMGNQQFHKYPHELSGGQRQRVVIARSMVSHPGFIVCDEPVSALDVSVRSQVLNLMKDAQEEYGMAYLFISHDLSVVRYLCDRIAVMYLGRIVEEAPKRELFGHPEHPYTKALLSAVPVPDVDIHNKRIILEGDVPTPISPPTGCHFHTRCPYATELCRKDSPILREISEGHSVACHLVKE